MLRFAFDPGEPDQTQNALEFATGHKISQGNLVCHTQRMRCDDICLYLGPADLRLRCDHFTTLEGATLSASATSRTVSPRSSRAIARSRISIERGLVMKAGLHTPAPTLNQKSTRQGIPQDSNKRHSALGLVAFNGDQTAILRNVSLPATKAS